MNDASFALSEPTPLVHCLSEHFSQRSLAQLLGAQAASLGERIWGSALHTPLADFLQRPGKEFRSRLLLDSYAMAGGHGPAPVQLGQMVEILHAGSLIIDDIQDQSTSRRGLPALHCAYGLPVALNAGNWLYFWAFSWVDELELSAEVKLQIYRWTSRQLLACHHGQALDLTLRIDALEQARVADVVAVTTQLKTGSLMELSAALGAIAAGATPEVLQRLTDFGARIGAALQMLDDVGGLVSEKRCHKGHEDLLLGRPTWPWAWLAEQLPAERYAELRKQAAQVQQRDLHPEVLARALQRELHGSGRVRIRRHLQEAFAELRAALGSCPALTTIEAELARLEKSYG